jgi:signal transduction histidine kinase
MTRRDQQRLPGSLRLRFLLAILLWVVIGISAIWFSAIRVFASHIEQSYHEELEVHVRELARLTELGPDGQPKLSRPLSDPRYEVPLSGFYWQVTVPGKRALRSESLTRGALDAEVAHSPAISHKVETGPTGPAITYGFVAPGPKGEGIHFVIATDQSELDRVIDSFTRELTLWLGGLGVLLLATGVAIIDFGLRPLRQLAEAISRLRRGGTQQLEGHYPVEIAPLVADLNVYIRQNAEMIARARVQAGNLAHSLRTPLAVVTDEAERLAERGDADATARVLLNQAHMMELQIEYQLAQARSSAGARMPGATSRVRELLLPILSAMHRLHPDTAFTLSDTACDLGELPVDPVDLSELLSILLDNAGKWAREHVVIDLLRAPGAPFDIRIRDDGPGMTPEQIANAFEVGSRFDPGKPGSGLGLAIARDICAAIGARLTLESGPRGLTANIRFPAARDAR